MSDLGGTQRPRSGAGRPVSSRLLLFVLAGGFGALALLLGPQGQRPARAEPAEADPTAGEIRLTRRAIYPSERRQAAPAEGREVAVNPPSLLWPRAQGKDVRYDVRLSQDKTFPEGKTLTSAGQPWALFNPHKKLASGTWYWQYAVCGAGAPAWSPANVFRVTDAARVFETHTAKELAAACPRSHPRLLVRAENLEAFRKRVGKLDQAAAMVTVARKHLGQKLPSDQEDMPRRGTKEGMEKHPGKLIADASKELGQRVLGAASSLCKAYLITGDEQFGREAVRWALRVAEWDRKGLSGKSDFGDMYCLQALVLSYDSCFGLLTAAEKQKLLGAIRDRADHFLRVKWMNYLETVYSQLHAWQGILHSNLQAAVATLGELPEAEQWLTYAYEVWLARAPTQGCDDGGWMVGTNYNGVEGEALIETPALLQSLTGDHYFDTPFYRNNLYYLIYCQPPLSYGDGFGDGYEMQKGPRPSHLGYVDALGRRVANPYASWYLKKALEVEVRRKAKKDLEWRSLAAENEPPLPPLTGPFALPQARAFREAGVVAMHTHLDDPRHDLFVGFRSSPYGSFAHAQADQNTFNLLAGGERLFYSSGFKIADADPHMIGWYKHTRGHNGVLVDGKGQPLGTEAYGWIPRYLHGERITYCVGDASRAYDVARPVPAEAQVKGMPVDGKAGLTRFRRHVILLRPSTVVVYDELAADHDAEWSWLLHSMEKLQVEGDKQRLFATAAGARGRVDLRGSVPLRFDVTGHFAIPAVNWRGKVQANKEVEYKDDQWHFTAVSGRKTAAMRFLAVIQVRQAGDRSDFTEAAPDADGWVRVGGWRIRAELDASKRPALEVLSADGSAGLVTGRTGLTAGGKRYDARLAGGALLVEKVADKWLAQEAVDELPAAAR